MHDQEFKRNLKEIYEFVDYHKIRSFYIAGYDYHPSISLVDLLDQKKDIHPNFCIRLDTKVPSWSIDKKILEMRFPNYFVLCESIHKF
jgi:hypothetical protein